MSIKVELEIYLRSQSLITDLLGLDDDFRYYPDFAPGGSLFPYVTYEVSSTEPVQHMTGTSKLHGIDMEFDIWAESNSQRTAVVDAFRNVLEGFNGVMGSLDVVSRLINEIDKNQRPDDGSDIPTFNAVSIFEIWYDRPVPTLP